MINSHNDTFTILIKNKLSAVSINQIKPPVFLRDCDDKEPLIPTDEKTKGIEPPNFEQPENPNQIFEDLREAVHISID